MKNSYFQFKQFRIEQDRCAMKVCTDACLFGAWTAAKIERLYPGNFNALDIGAGTGLLSLMLAQETEAVIEAWEIDEGASSQAVENSVASPWRHRISVLRTDARHHDPQKKFDFIISNPPFYEGDLKSSAESTRIAWHSELLTLAELLEVIDLHLSADGYASLLLPFHRTAELISLAGEAGLLPRSLMYMKPSDRHPPFRTCLLLSREKNAPTTDEVICIRKDGAYSRAFTRLLKNFYLHH